MSGSTTLPANETPAPKSTWRGNGRLAETPHARTADLELAVAILVVLGAEGSDRVAAELPVHSARAEGQSPASRAALQRVGARAPPRSGPQHCAGQTHTSVILRAVSSLIAGATWCCVMM